LIRYWLEYFPFIIIATIVRLLPRKAAMSLGRRLGSLGRYLQPGRVNIADDNLRQAFPEMPETERGELVNRVFSDLGVGFVEMLRLDMMNGQDDLEKLFTIEGAQHIPDALALNRGCILLTGHVGSWEAGNFVLPTLGFPIAVVAKPMRNPLVDAYFRRMRQSYGAYMIDSRKGARRIYKALKQNHVVGILMDQHIKKNEAVKVPFFGRPAHTTPIIAQIAMKHRVPIVPVFSYRNPDDTYLIKASAPILLEGELSDENIVANTAKLTKCIEDGIMHDVSQWFWVHRRWK